MTRLSLLLYLLSLACIPTSAIEKERVDKARWQLDNVIQHRGTYIAKRQDHIDSLCNLIGNSGSNMPDIYMKIADAYKGFNNDSSLTYLRRGIACTYGVDSYPFRFKYAALMPLDGLFDTAKEIFNSIPVDSIPAEQLPDYFDAGRQMNSYIASSFVGSPEVAKEYTDMAIDYQRRLLEVLPSDTPAYRYNKAEYAFLTGEATIARILLEEIFDNEAADSPVKARVAHHLSNIALNDGDESAYTYYLITSAIADISSATRELLSLQDLGAFAYSKGDMTRAYRYLSTALECAVECAAPLRMVVVAKSLPIIEKAYTQEVSKSRRDTVMVIIGLVALMFFLLAILLVLRQEIRKMQTLQSKLKAANAAKEVYISQFLLLCSIYMDKLNQFCKIATRKLSSGQADELYKMTKSGKFVEEQSREFYEIFDNAFLHIYPDFVHQVNKLLRADARFDVPSKGTLNTDLRILAFMRLGIEESQRIAQVLNYSLNTIYSYRNRLKARAINRDTFEDDIMQISSVS